MADLVVDLRSGLRQLAGQKTSSAIAIVTLSLGVGVTAAVFSVADATMLRPLPYPNPEQLVTIEVQEVLADGKVQRATSSMAEMRALQSEKEVFAFVAGIGSAVGGVISDEAPPRRLRVNHFTEDYLPMLGVTPMLGRGFTREDTEPQSPLVALLGYGYWQSRYGGGEVLGQPLRLQDQTATIVGVLPPGFNATMSVATPLRIPPREFYRRGTGRVQVWARLRRDVALEQAQHRLAVWQGVQMPPGMSLRVLVQSHLDTLTTRYRTTVLVFLGAVGLIVALAAVNVAGLLLARGSARQLELAVRSSLGAGRSRLVRQLFLESLVLLAPALVLGLVFAWLSLGAIVANLPMTVPENSPITLNTTVVALTAAVLMPATLLFGLLPAFQLSRRARVVSMMARGARQFGSPLTRRGGQMLIAAEIALAVVLVSGAGLMIRSFVRISAVDLGFDIDDVITMEVMPLDAASQARKGYLDQLLDRTRTLEGVMAAGLVDNVALGAGTAFSTVSSGTQTTFSQVFRATPGYFAAINIAPRQGRLPTDVDYQAGYRGVVINESAARKLFPDGPAVGRAVSQRGVDQPLTVIGVIADLRHGGPLDTRGAGVPQVFFPFEVRDDELPFPTMLVVRRSRTTPLPGDRLRDTARSIGPPVLVERIRAGEDWFTDRVITPRRQMMLLGLLGGLGLLLALVGVAGMTMYAVTRRTTEIGVRVAFGARPVEVVGTIVRDASWPLLIGVAIGTGGAMLASRVIQSFLFETDPQDPLTLGLVAVVLLISGAAAAVIPALRATRIDPVTCLRSE